jgi:hypothetical protein
MNSSHRVRSVILFVLVMLVTGVGLFHGNGFPKARIPSGKLPFQQGTQKSLGVNNQNPLDTQVRYVQNRIEGGSPDIDVEPTLLEFDALYEGVSSPASGHARSAPLPQSIRMLKDGNLSLGSARSQAAYSLECNISTLSVRHDTENGYDVFRLASEDFELHADRIGDPLLPMMTVRVLILPGSDIDNLLVSVPEKRELSGSYLLFPSQPQAKTSDQRGDEQIDFVPLNPELAASSLPFPRVPVEHVGTSILRGHNIAIFRMWPIQYVPASGKIILNQRIEWSFQSIPGKKTGLRYAERQPQMERLIEGMVVNPEGLDKLSLMTLSSNIRAAAAMCDYLLITDSTLSAGFEPLRQQKQALGLNAEILTTNSIYQNYTGLDNQEKLKRCITDYAANRGALWVLLGGDDTIVPDRNCYGRVNSTTGVKTDNTIPTDLYYAGLDDFNWDDDGDNQWGEGYDDTVDFFPDVFIGRAPVRTQAQAANFVTKTLAYFNTPPVADFTEKALLSGTQLWNIWDGKSDAHWRSEAMWNDYMEPYWKGKHYQFYDTGTDFEGEAGYDVTDVHLIEQINKGYGILFMVAHGSQSTWGMESGLFNTSDAFACTNSDRQGIIYTTACDTNAFDREYVSDPCLSEAFLRDADGGSVAYIGSSRFGWGYPAISIVPGTSIRYARQFFKQLLNPFSLLSGSVSDPDPYHYPRQIGAVFASHKMYYAGSVTHEAFRWLMFSLNLMGDPHLQVHTEDPDGFTISNKGTDDLIVTSIENMNGSPWVSCDPDASFTVVPDATRSINVSIDASGLAPGVYSERLLIYSNDPDENPFPNGVDVQLTVHTPVKISGKVLDSLGGAVRGVRIEFETSGGGTWTVDSAADGTYSSDVPSGWSGKVKASKEDYSFEPAWQDFTGVNTDQTLDFTASPYITEVTILYPFSGIVSGGVSIGVEASTSPLTISAQSVKKVEIFIDDQKIDEFINPPYVSLWDSTGAADGGHTIKAVATNAAGVTGEDEVFVAVFNSKWISGAVKYAGAGLGGVTMIFGTTGGGTARETTAADGSYSHCVPYGWSGTVTPDKSGWIFYPDKREYDIVISAFAAQDFDGFHDTRKADLLGSWKDQGVYLRNSDTGGWTKMAAPADKITSGDLDGDNIDDLIGIWDDQGGVWIKYSKSALWSRISTTAQWICSGDMNGDGSVDFLGSWAGQGVYYLDAGSLQWVKIASSATQITAGDFDGDGKDDLAGIWPSQGGVWAKFSSTGEWERLSSTADWIAAGDMNGDGRCDLLGDWSGQGVFYKDMMAGSWHKFASCSDQITCGDMDGDGLSDLIGTWASSNGVWVRYSGTGTWERIASTPDWISCGKMRPDSGSIGKNELESPQGGQAAGPLLDGYFADRGSKSPGEEGFSFIEGSNLTPASVEKGNYIPGPGEKGFVYIEEKNIFPEGWKDNGN